MYTPYPKPHQGFKRPHFTGASWYGGQVYCNVTMLHFIPFH